jgi:EamA domain-containing membrane protein RarD
MIKKLIEQRLAQRSTVDGVVLVGAGVAFILLGPLAKVAAYLAIVYGAYTIWRKH